MFTSETKDFRPSVEEAMDDIIYALTKWQPAEVKAVEQKPFVFEGKDYQDAVYRMNRRFLARRMGDGLPLIPPVKEVVEWMLTGVDLPADEAVASFEPLNRPVTVRNIAINAAMAGARPEYMPVLIATLKALAQSGQPGLLFTGVGMFAPVIVINGPIAKELNINSGVGLMGPGWQANATIGRAISLIFINGVGQIPGPESTSSQSLPGRYTWCFAENEEANPWQPFHAELGYAPGVSTVSVMAGRGTHTVMVEPPAARILGAIAHAVEGLTVCYYAMPHDQLLILSPTHAKILAAEGWKKEDIRRYIYENGRIPFHKAEAAGMTLEGAEKWQTAVGTSTMVPMIRGAEYLVVIVAGGPGSHNSTLVPCIKRRATEEIDKYKPKRWKELIREADTE